MCNETTLFAFKRMNIYVKLDKILVYGISLTDCHKSHNLEPGVILRNRNQTPTIFYRPLACLYTQSSYDNRKHFKLKLS